MISANDDLGPSSPAALRQVVLAAAREQGCALAGVARVEQFPALRHFAPWIAGGRHGEMRYLERTPEGGGQEPGRAGADHGPAGRAAEPAYLRADVRRAFPWARSVVCCGMNYNAPGPRSTDAREPGQGWVARYAWGDDYHKLFVGKLRAIAARLEGAMAEEGAAEPGTGAPGGAEAGAATRVYVDTGPLVERVVAYHAGLGWLGKNTCLIHPRIGSFFFLGVILAAAEIAADEPLPDRCGSCTRCLQACPTGALTPYAMDARRCLAYLNLELRGPIPAEFREPMGANIIGCDICQDVCPWNEKAGPMELAPELAPREERIAPDLAALARLSAEEYRQAFRGSAAKRAKYTGLLRNVAVALGNNPGPDARPILAEMARHPDPMVRELVREHAEWALAKLAAAGVADAQLAGANAARE